MKKFNRQWLATALGVILVTASGAAVAQTDFTLEKREPALTADRYGDLTLGAVIRTDERYGRDHLMQGPRGWAYWNRLENPKDYQNPNLWGDKPPTYFMSELKMLPGTKLTLRGRFPHARYYKFALYRFERNTYIALGGEDLAAWDIEPDGGSVNPYIVGADRTAENRDFTVHVVAEDAPKNRADRAPNTMYAGSEERAIQIIIRIYVPDEGYDGAGLALADAPVPVKPLFTYEATLADGTRLSAEDVAERFALPIGAAPPPVSKDQWYAMISSKENDPALEPTSAPARKDSQFEIFRGMNFTVAGAFMPPDKRAQIKLQTEMEGGGDPTTAYLVNYLSREFGPVYVFRAKMPTFPDTFSGAKTMADGQVKYWSVVTAASAPSGELWDGVFDMMVPLDNDGYYTIVVSRPEDRPSNATRENGIEWIDWGPGEGLDDPRNRENWGMLLMRFMVCHPDWEECPGRARESGTEEAVMGPYFPKGYYTSKTEFEANGPSN